MHVMYMCVYIYTHTRAHAHKALADPHASCPRVSDTYNACCVYDAQSAYCQAHGLAAREAAMAGRSRMPKELMQHGELENG